MTIAQPHLEHRATGFYWRRRVPARARTRFEPDFFCFPLRTHVPREAAERARRLTAISDFCFNAEPDVSPDVMTNILVTYARIEIDLCDRLRALTGPRSRAAAEAAMDLEAASRVSLRDAIFRCDKTPALNPIRDVAGQLGLIIDEREDDFAILADKMIRLMIEVSEEKERRARGQFSDIQPYLAAALNRSAALLPPPEKPTAGSAQSAPHPTSQPQDALTQAEPEKASAGITAATIVEKEPPVTAPSAITDEQEGPQETIIIHAENNRTISLDPKLLKPAQILDGTDPTILELWDDWFNAMSSGVCREGEYIYEDAGKAKRFLKDADTTKSTRKLVRDIFGDTRLSEATAQDWKRFNDIVRELPTTHGRSPILRDLTCLEFIDREKTKAAARLAAAKKKIRAQGLKGDDAELLLREAKMKTIAPRTFQRHQKYLCAPLDFAVAQRRISNNPFKPFVLGEAAIKELGKSHPETQRMIWTSEELTALLCTEMWQSPKTKIDSPVFWLPLIARLHGLRSEEILQLKPKNIRCDDGIHFFDIERGTGQSLKSNNARRFVPIHSQLIELGFLELVARQKRLGKERIFATVDRSKSSRLTYTATFTKKFTYYRQSRGVYAKRQDLHAMRTTFNTKCVARSVPDTARRYMMGHRNDDVGIVNYLPEGFPLKTLQEHIEQDRLDLSMIKRRFGTSPATKNAPRLVTQNGIALSA